MSEEMLNAARNYSKDGKVVHPLASPEDQGNSPGKRPLLTGWQKRTQPATEEELERWFKEKDNNIGLVCGKASGVTVIDYDHTLFWEPILKGLDLLTRSARRTEGRGHVYFQYNQDLKSQKHHLLGIEILSDGSNAVLPPSKHSSGDNYQWVNPDAPIAPMPAVLLKRLNQLFQIEARLVQQIGECRPCFKKLWNGGKPEALHGADGREVMLAWAAELKAKGAGLDEIIMLARLVYKNEFRSKDTAHEWKNIKTNPWTCKKIKERLSSIISCVGCQPSRMGFNPGGILTFKSEMKSDQVQAKELSLDDILNLRSKRESRKLTLDVPEGHFILKFMKWVASTTDAYSDYAIVCGLILLSAATKRRVYIKLKQEVIYANVWAFLLGNSTTSRKSTIVNKTQSILRTAFAINEGPEIYSYEGYIEYLSEHPIAVFIRDEAAALLCEYKKKYMQGIVDTECLLYDCKKVSKTLARGKHKELREYRVQDPFIIKLYATTPDSLSRHTDIEDMTSGWLLRFLFVAPDYQKPFMPLDLESKEDVKLWGDVVTHLKKLHQDIEMRGDVDFKIDSEALKFIQAAQQQLEESVQSQGNQIYAAAAGRAIPYAFKIAMLLELGKPEPSYGITLASMRTAFRIMVDYFIPVIVDVAARLEEDIRKNEISKFLYYLKRHNGLATHSKLLHDTKQVSRIFNECAETLLEAGAIEIIRQENTKAIWYHLIDQDSPIPQILQVLSFSDRTNKVENLENSGKRVNIVNETGMQEDNKTDIHARAPAPSIRTNTLREPENRENLENLENCGSHDQSLNSTESGEDNCLLEDIYSALSEGSKQEQNEQESKSISRISQRDRAAILQKIRQEWYGASSPKEIFAVKEMFEAEFKTRCETAGDSISDEAAHIYVTNVFREWEWM